MRPSVPAFHKHREREQGTGNKAGPSGEQGGRSLSFYARVCFTSRDRPDSVKRGTKSSKTACFHHVPFGGTITRPALQGEAKQVVFLSLLTAFIELLLCAHRKVRPQGRPLPSNSPEPGLDPGLGCALTVSPRRPVRASLLPNRHTTPCTRQTLTSPHFTDSFVNSLTCLLSS